MTFLILKQKRLLNDREINNTPIDILQDGNWVTLPWRMLKVGDIVRVRLL